MIERDPHTGHATTGHDWNGIKELNTAIPRPVWLFLIGTVLFSVGYWVLMPAWPTGTTYTKGLLGADVRRTLEADLGRAAAGRAAWTSRLEAGDLAAAGADAELMAHVRETGRALFGDNCAVCHGTAGTGGPGFPSLADDAWLWGGTADAVLETIRVGVNSGHPDARISQMPAFGRDQMLDRASILAAVAYVRSLAAGSSAVADAAPVEAGREVFAANCSGCHGADGQGSTELGAPNLTDGFWLYGGDTESVHRTVHGGREGRMPAWEGRLTAAERRILALYVLDLGKGRR